MNGTYKILTKKICFIHSPKQYCHNCATDFFAGDVPCCFNDFFIFFRSGHKMSVQALYIDCRKTTERNQTMKQQYGIEDLIIFLFSLLGFALFVTIYFPEPILIALSWLLFCIFIIIFKSNCDNCKAREKSMKNNNACANSDFQEKLRVLYLKYTLLPPNSNTASAPNSAPGHYQCRKLKCKEFNLDKRR